MAQATRRTPKNRREHHVCQVDDLLADDLVDVGSYHHVQPAVRFGILVRELLRDRGELGSSLRLGYPVGEASEDEITAPVSARSQSNGIHGQPELLSNRESETLGHNAYHAARDTIDHEAPADDRGVAIETILPDAVGEHDHGLGAGKLVIRLEIPPEVGLHVEQAEQIRAHVTRVVALRFAVFRSQEREVFSPDRQALEGSLTVTPVREIVHRDQPSRSVLRAVRHDVLQPGRVLERQAPKDRAVDDAEHRGRQPDADRERDDGNGTDSRASDEQARGVAHVFRRNEEPFTQSATLRCGSPRVATAQLFPGETVEARVAREPGNEDGLAKDINCRGIPASAVERSRRCAVASPASGERGRRDASE